MEKKGETFQYTYSAKEQQELERIRQKYVPREEDKLTQLRKLDKSAERAGTIVSIVMGVIGTMLFGVGMCCTTVWAEPFFVLGIVAGVPGIVLIALAYPVYRKVTRMRREKIAPQILALMEELEK